MPVSLLAADLIAIIATWMKTYRHLKQASSLGIPSVGQILLRDGALLVRYHMRVFLTEDQAVFIFCMPFPLYLNVPDTGVLITLIVHCLS